MIYDLFKTLKKTNTNDGYTYAEIVSINHCYHIAWFENRGYNLRNVKRNKT